MRDVLAARQPVPDQLTLAPPALDAASLEQKRLLGAAAALLEASIHWTQGNTRKCPLYHSPGAPGHERFPLKGTQGNGRVPISVAPS